MMRGRKYANLAEKFSPFCGMVKVLKLFNRGLLNHRLDPPMST